jgi:hypothetical protein
MTEKLKSNWFWPLFAVLLGAAFLISRYQVTYLPQSWEYAVVFDMLFTVPVFFVLCYRKRLSLKELIIRVLGIQCLGIWIAAQLVPLESQTLLPQLAWLRYAGLAVLILIELRIMVLLFKVVFKVETTTRQLEDIGMPPLLTKIVLIEARFWRWVFSRFKR